MPFGFEQKHSEQHVFDAYHKDTEGNLFKTQIFSHGIHGLFGCLHTNNLGMFFYPLSYTPALT
jgi:hypothetical protein